MIEEETFFRLDEILAVNGNEGSMVESSELHGLLAALVCSGQEVSSEDMTQLIWDVPQVEFETPEDEKDFYEILEAMKKESEEGFESGDFHPLFAEFEDDDGESMVDVEVWCEGFCLAIEQNQDVWQKLIDEKHKGLHIITLFGTEEGHGVLDITPEEEIETFAQAIGPATKEVYQAFR